MVPSGFFAEPSRGGSPEVEKALALAEALDEDGEQGAQQQEKLEKQLGEDLALLDELHGTNKRSAKSLWLRAKGVAIAEARKLILQHEHDIDAEELNNRAYKSALGEDDAQPGQDDDQHDNLAGMQDRQRKAAKQKGQYCYSAFMGCRQACGHRDMKVCSLIFQSIFSLYSVNVQCEMFAIPLVH